MHLDTIRDSLETQDADTFGLVVMTTGGNDLIHDYGRSPPREGAMYGATLEQAQPWIENFEKRLSEMIELSGSPISRRLHDLPGRHLRSERRRGRSAPALFAARLARLHGRFTGAYNDVIHRCAEKHKSVHVVPMHAEFLGHGIHCTQPWRKHYRADDPHYWYAWNLEDPNIRGYDAIRRLFLIEIAKQADQFSTG